MSAGVLAAGSHKNRIARLVNNLLQTCVSKEKGSEFAAPIDV
jgi:hypothetical protein